MLTHFMAQTYAIFLNVRVVIVYFSIGLHTQYIRYVKNLYELEIGVYLSKEDVPT